MAWSCPKHAQCMNGYPKLSSDGPHLERGKKEAKNHLVKNSDERAEGAGFNMV